MPAPTKIDTDRLIAAARALLEHDGVEGLTMQGLAAALGVRAPSLYKHVKDRDDLLGRVRDATLIDLGDALARVRDVDPATRLLGYGLSVRQFGRRWPHGKALAFSRAGTPADRALLAQTVEPVLTACHELVGEPDALDAARTITSWMHGFTEMERAGAFQLGGDVDRAYRYGIETIVGALASDAR